MHDTAFKIGGFVMSEYCSLDSADVLELGSLNVNGSLRDHALPGTRYVGIDREPGPGVDIVADADGPSPVDDASFDLVMASSVLEHDPLFWMTFLDMCRKARPGGYIYINVPSNGLFHRFPEDHWRFYPDSAKALIRWAKSQDVDVELVESFVAEREREGWNDFCAIFRRGGGGTPLPDRFVHQLVACTNVLTWKSDDMELVSFQPEDMRRLEYGKEREARLERDLISRNEDIVRLNAETRDLRDLRAHVESELRQRQEEISQTRALMEERERLLGTTEETLSARERELHAVSLELASVQGKLVDSDRWVFHLAGVRRANELELARLNAALERERRALAAAQSELEEQRKRVLLEVSPRRDAPVGKQATVDHRAGSFTEKLRDPSLQELLGELRAQLKWSVVVGGESGAEGDDPALGERPRFVTEVAAPKPASSVATRPLAAGHAASGASSDEADVTIPQLIREQHEMRRLLAEGERARELIDQRVRQEEAKYANEISRSMWLHEVSKVMVAPSPWWWGLMPEPWRRARMQAKLKKRGLFDAGAYLASNPDVQGEGLDPLQHYIRHGLDEGRSRSKPEGR